MLHHPYYFGEETFFPLLYHYIYLLKHASGLIDVIVNSITYVFQFNLRSKALQEIILLS